MIENDQAEVERIQEELRQLDSLHAEEHSSRTVNLSKWTELNKKNRLKNLVENRSAELKTNKKKRELGN
jgi:hypothetical protein